MQKRGAGLAFGVAGVAVASAMQRRKESQRSELEHEVANRIPKKTAYLLLTTENLWCLSVNALSKPKEVLGAVARRDIAGFEGKKAKIAVGKLTVHFSDGTSTVLDLKSDRKLNEFLDAANAAVTRA
jgi:hypothetical protein